MKKKLCLLISIGFIIRAFIACFLEFGNDEVYYYTYAQNLDFSYFDHPGMVGWMSYLSSFGLTMDSEFMLRLFPIFIGSFNTYLIFKITALLKDEIAGFWAAVLYTASIYGSVIIGVFLMPDAPLSLCWLLGLYFILKASLTQNLNYLIAFGFSLAFGLMSKYQAVFLGFGVGVYILKYQFHWLKKPKLWIAFLITFLGLIPTIYWNMENHWISFSFHSGRVGNSFTLEYFPREIFGQILYHNPINVGLMIYAFIIWKKKEIHSISKAIVHLLLFIALPLWIISIGLSFFDETFPHWSGVSFFSFIILTSIILRENKNLIKWSKIALGLTAFIMICGFFEIQNGWFMNLKSRQQPIEKKGKYDFTQDTYGWKQLGNKFGTIIEKENTNLLLSYKWYPASHLEYYVAKPNKMDFIAIGDTANIHRYAWEDSKSILAQNNDKSYYITSSNHFKNPYQIYDSLFSIQAIDTIAITRRKDTIRLEFVYLLTKK